MEYVSMPNTIEKNLVTLIFQLNLRSYTKVTQTNCKCSNKFKFYIIYIPQMSYDDFVTIFFISKIQKILQNMGVVH
jgi:hypothetical protein